MEDESKKQNDHSPGKLVDAMKSICAKEKPFDVLKFGTNTKTSFIIRHFNDDVTYSAVRLLSIFMSFLYVFSI